MAAADQEVRDENFLSVSHYLFIYIIINKLCMAVPEVIYIIYTMQHN